MKTIRSTSTERVSESSAKEVRRRGLVVGAGVAGAAAVAASALHRSIVAAPAAGAAATASPQGEGYRLTPHVLRYYETTKA